MPKTLMKKPVWAGPCDPSPRGGITQSLLGRFLCCRERFRLTVIEGIKPKPHFNPAMDYGNMWHACEEAHAANKHHAPKLFEHCRELTARMPMDRNLIEQWMGVCLVQFPIYQQWWEKHPDVKNRTPLLQEQEFHVPYKLPSGRSVWLRGKWDSVDLIKEGKTSAIWLQENKTKSRIDREKISRQLTFDLQTMLYLIALDNSEDRDKICEKVKGDYPIKGVRYNVIQRRPPLVQKKPSKSNPRGETKDEYFQRMGEIIQENPKEYFDRWQVVVTSGDVQEFKGTCLNPLLENLCDWYQIQADDGKCKVWAGASGQHWRHPFGGYNVLDEGGSSDLDEYLRTGSMAGLMKTDNLFPELKGEF